MAKKPTHKINVAEVEYVASRLAQELMEWGEPIPEFQTRFPNILESCLRTPFQTYARKSLYQGIEKKGAILSYLLIKNHPFQNGNKRVAVVTLIYFLETNRRKLEVSSDSLYLFARHVAESDPVSKDTIISEIVDYIKNNSQQL